MISFPRYAKKLSYLVFSFSSVFAEVLPRPNHIRGREILFPAGAGRNIPPAEGLPNADPREIQERRCARI